MRSDEDNGSAFKAQLEEIQQILASEDFCRHDAHEKEDANVPETKDFSLHNLTNLRILSRTHS